MDSNSPVVAYRALRSKNIVCSVTSGPVSGRTDDDNLSTSGGHFTDPIHRKRELSSGCTRSVTHTTRNVPHVPVTSNLAPTNIDSHVVTSNTRTDDTARTNPPRNSNLNVDGLSREPLKSGPSSNKNLITSSLSPVHLYTDDGVKLVPPKKPDNNNNARNRLNWLLYFRRCLRSRYKERRRTINTSVDACLRLFQPKIREAIVSVFTEFSLSVAFSRSA